MTNIDQGIRSDVCSKACNVSLFFFFLIRTNMDQCQDVLDVPASRLHILTVTEERCDCERVI